MLHMHAAGVPAWLLGEAPSRKKCWISPLLAYVRRLNEAPDPAGREEKRRRRRGCVEAEFLYFYD